MKKTIITAASVVLIIIIGFFSAYFITTSPKNSGEFCVDEFSAEIEQFAFTDDENYGNISDYKSAAKVGRTVIDDSFGKNSNGSIFKWMGCDVQYDPQNEIYHVRIYHVDPNVKGGAYNAIIKSNGTILAIWGEK